MMNFLRPRRLLVRATSGSIRSLCSSHSSSTTTFLSDDVAQKKTLLLPGEDDDKKRSVVPKRVSFSMDPDEVITTVLANHEESFWNLQPQQDEATTSPSDTATTWYTKSEMQAIRLECARMVHTMKRRADNNHNNNDHTNANAFWGLQKLLDPDEIALIREECSDAVMAEQAAQIRQGIVDADRIARAYRRARQHRLAAKVTSV